MNYKVKIKVDGNLLLLNGQPIKFKGVNRHSSTVNGYVETIKDLEKDLQIIETDDDYISPFFGCKQLKEIVLPEGLEEISSYAFNKCYGLETIKIPESVKSISNSLTYYKDVFERHEKGF